ncbi:MAG TPA: oligosaccharide flippase family protein [Planctomycetota bacterium]|nr:oligosaccharide flippase family protein [Planctomycetota bacterium]
MSLRRRIFGGGVLLGAHHIAAEALHFVRSVIVARILTPADFGVAATFWITTGFLATISELGFQQLLIQAREGDDERFGATIQTMMTARSLLIGVIFALAGPVASMFRVPEATWAFRLLAVVSVLSGFHHRDMTRLKRALRFAPAVVSDLVPRVVTTLLAWPIATYVGDYSAFVWLAIIQTGLSTAFSHVLAERPFRLGWEWTVVRRSFGFGWPLLLNSLLMFAVMQGDRVILARAYTKAELGVYSVAIGLAMASCGVVMNIASQLLLPVFSVFQQNRKRFEATYVLFAQAATAVGLILGALFFMLGPALVSIVYGGRYALAGSVVGWLAAAQSIRLLRAAPTTAAMALGDTRNSLVANVFRQSGLALALIAATVRTSVAWIAIAGVVGEALALGASIMYMRRRHGLAARPAVVCSAFLVSGLLLSAWVGMSDRV